MKIWLDTGKTYGWDGLAGEIDLPAVPRVGDTLSGTFCERWGEGVVRSVDWEIDTGRVVVVLSDVE